MEIRYAISDIHGNARAFLKLLDYVDPDPEKLVICGDLVDRGLDSWGVYVEVDQLIDEGTRVITGNHDLYYKSFVSGGLAPIRFHDEKIGGLTTDRSFKLAVQRHGESMVHGLRKRVFDAMIPYYETDEFIFVHAGIDPRIPDMGRQSLHSLTEGCNEWRGAVDHPFDQVIVFGHTPTFYIHRDIKEDDATVWYSRAKRKMAIDTGAGFGCRLTMMDLQEGRSYSYDFATDKIIERQAMNPNAFKRRNY